MSEILFVAEQEPDGGFVARAHGHAIFTQADTDSEAELAEAVRDAVRCHFDEAERPALIRLHIVRDIVLAA